MTVSSSKRMSSWTALKAHFCVPDRAPEKQTRVGGTKRSASSVTLRHTEPACAMIWLVASSGSRRLTRAPSASIKEFYDTRFHIGFTSQDKSDLVAFLRSL